MAKQKSNRISRRKFLEMAAVAGVAGAAAACAPTPTAAPTSVPPTQAPAPTTAPTKAPAPTNTPVPPTPAPTKKTVEQTIRFGSVGKPISGYFPAGFSSSERTMLSNVFTPPLIRDKDHNLMPGLLKSYESDATGTVWTLKLDPKAKWSDGSKITATDLKLGWEANLAPAPADVKITKFLVFVDMALGTVKGKQDFRDGKANEVTGIQVVDGETVRVETSEPDFSFPQKLALPPAGIMKADQWKKDFFIFEKPEVLTNGPYRITKYDKDGGEWIFEPNPNWWGDPPGIKRVQIRGGIAEATLLTMWKNNEIDVMEISSGAYKEIYAGPDKDLAVYHPYSGIAQGFYFNISKEPLNDINLRKAMCLATDPVTIVNTVLGAADQPALGFIQKSQQCSPKRDRTYPYDVAAAKAALAASKYGTADKVPKMTICDHIGIQVPHLEAVVEQWRTNLGLRMDWVKDTTAVGVAKAEKQYDITELSMGAIIPDPYVWLRTAWTHFTQPTGYYYAQIGYKSEALDKALDAAGKLKLDDPTRCAALQAAEKIMLDDYIGFGVNAVLFRHFVKPWVKNWLTNNDLSPYTLAGKVTVTEH